MRGERAENEIRIDEQCVGREPATAAPLAAPIAAQSKCDVWMPKLEQFYGK